MASVRHLFNRTLTVRRGTRVADPYGGGTELLADVGTVAARVSRPAPTEREVGQQEGVRTGVEIYLDLAADVRRGDQLIGDGQTFEVIAVTFPSRRDYLKADAREDTP